MLPVLADIPAGDVLVLHGCCHNPTGIDPTAEQWSRIAEVIARRQLLTLVDFAYQGLAEGIREDAAGLTTLVRTGQELFVASSFSKNFGLYNERVGALSAVCKNGKAAAGRLEPTEDVHSRELLQPAGTRCGDRRHDSVRSAACGPSGIRKFARFANGSTACGASSCERWPRKA